MTATPHAVAAGVAAGAFTSFTPFIGLHFIIAFVLAWLIRGNLLASALGTFVGNPFTFPLIWAATYQTGHHILGSSATSSGSSGLAEAMKDVVPSLFHLDGTAAMIALKQIWLPFLYPMSTGGLVLGTLVFLLVYFVTRRTAALFRESRRNKLMQKAAEIQEKAKQMASKRNVSKSFAQR